MNTRVIEIPFADTPLRVKHLNERNFYELLEDKRFARKEIINPDKNSYSRFYINSDGKHLLEFYFGGGILVEKEQDLERIRRVDFSQMQTWLFGDEISRVVLL